MIWHILGWFTFVVELGTGGYVLRWLITNSTEQLRRPVHVSEVLDLDVLTTGSDFVGPV